MELGWGGGAILGAKRPLQTILSAYHLSYDMFEIVSSIWTGLSVSRSAIGWLDGQSKFPKRTGRLLLPGSNGALLQQIITLQSLIKIKK